MGIERVLLQQGWSLVPRKGWIAVKDDRDTFHAMFRTDRVGKLVGSKFYVTVRDIRAVAERQILEVGLQLEQVSSSSDKDVVYPGFACEGVSETTLQAFVERLHDTIDRQVEK